MLTDLILLSLQLILAGLIARKDKVPWILIKTQNKLPQSESTEADLDVILYLFFICLIFHTKCAIVAEIYNYWVQPLIKRERV